MRAYPTYKPSGVEWFDTVPEGWEVRKLGLSVPAISGGTTPNTDNPEYYDGGEIPWLNTGDLNDGPLIDCAKRVTDKALADHTTLRVYPPGSVVIALYGATIGKLGLLEFPACVNQACCVISQSDVLEGQFLFYWLLGFRERIISLASGGGQPNISQEVVRSLRIPLPPLPEQRAIAGFLDVEVGKIDELVQAQRRLIALLAEKRQAVISHAVTQGLTPNAPRKPSHIDWLGDIPEGWEVVAIKRLCERITDGAHISPQTEGGVFPFVSTKDVFNGEINFNDCLLTSPETYEYMVGTGCKPRKSDVLFSKDGTIGRTVVVRTDKDFVVASSLIIIRPDQTVLLPDFLNYLCMSSVVSEQVASYVKGAGLPRLSITNLLKVFGVLPPLDEQAAIVAYLDTQTAELDALTATSESVISLLAERRAALISAAVTGKIDLRDYAPKE